MILSNADIRRVLRDKLFIVDPFPSEDQIDTSSLDLRMGETLWEWNRRGPRPGGRDNPIDVDGLDIRQFTEQNLVEVPREAEGNYILEPGKLYLAPTHEKVKMPMESRLAARIEGRSSLARLGLTVHMTAPMIHCGTGLGIITLELCNHGPFYLRITPGATRICQLILEELSSLPDERAARTYGAQKNPKG
ncbi:MAG: dCTP deaminase [Nitrospinae bacterium CG11_big_fil_rev_8_21_14_0_20_56_8]|nr:MAG: dCTP deaminase [Nitrospinae bacterium CG11_big_fil_rev_8_21_14_0_20_56_8]